MSERQSSVARSGAGAQQRGSASPLPDKRAQPLLSGVGRDDVAEGLDRVADAAPIVVGSHERSAPELDRGARLGGKGSRQRTRLVAHLVVRDHSADEAERHGLVGAEAAATEQQLEGTVPADDLRQMHVMNSGDETAI